MREVPGFTRMILQIRIWHSLMNARVSRVGKTMALNGTNVVRLCNYCYIHTVLQFDTERFSSVDFRFHLVPFIKNL
jgi:hypothetical protein